MKTAAVRRFCGLDPNAGKGQLSGMAATGMQAVQNVRIHSRYMKEDLMLTRLELVDPYFRQDRGAVCWSCRGDDEPAGVYNDNLSFVP